MDSFVTILQNPEQQQCYSFFGYKVLNLVADVCGCFHIWLDFNSVFPCAYHIYSIYEHFAGPGCVVLLAGKGSSALSSYVFQCL